MSVCTCIAQDRAHLMQVLSRRLNVHCPSEHWLLFGAPLSEVSLSLGMADGASSRQSGRRQQLKPYVYSYQTQEAPGQRQQLKPYVYSYRTQEAPGQRQRLGLYAYNYYTQEAQLKPDVPFHQLTGRIFTLFAYPLFVITHFQLLHVFAHCICLVNSDLVIRMNTDIVTRANICVYNKPDD